MLMESPSQYQVIRLALFHLSPNTRLTVNLNEIEQFIIETISRIELNYFIQNFKGKSSSRETTNVLKLEGDNL